MNKLFNKKMYSLSLGESLKKGKQSITRVPGGWLYKIENTEEDIFDGCAMGYGYASVVFIPFNNEFQNDK